MSHVQWTSNRSRLSQQLAYAGPERCGPRHGLLWPASLPSHGRSGLAGAPSHSFDGLLAKTEIRLLSSPRKWSCPIRRSWFQVQAAFESPISSDFPADLYPPISPSWNFGHSYMAYSGIIVPSVRRLSDDWREAARRAWLSRIRVMQLDWDLGTTSGLALKLPESQLHLPLIVAAAPIVILTSASSRLTPNPHTRDGAEFFRDGNQGRGD